MIESKTDTIDDIIAEVAAARVTERGHPRRRQGQ